MRTFLILLFIFCISGISLAQRSDVIIKKADSLITITEYDQALILLNPNKSPDIQTKVLIANKVVEILMMQGKLDDADSKLKSIPETNSELGNAITLTNKGFLYLNKGRYDLALENLRLALNKFQNSKNQNTK